MGCTESSQEDLFYASQVGDISSVQQLLYEGIDVNSKDVRGNTALIIASQYGHLRVVNLLLAKKANVEHKCLYARGYTALMWACDKGHVEIVKTLLDNNAMINIRDNNGWTGLMWAIHYGRTECVKLLLDRRADITVTGNDGKTALAIAQERGQLIIHNLLTAVLDI